MKVFGFDFAPVLRDHPEFANHPYLKFLAEEATPPLFDGQYCTEQWIRLHPEDESIFHNPGESLEQADQRYAEENRVDLLQRLGEKPEDEPLLEIVRHMRPVYAGTLEDASAAKPQNKSKIPEGPQLL